MTTIKESIINLLITTRKLNFIQAMMRLQKVLIGQNQLYMYI